MSAPALPELGDLPDGVVATHRAAWAGHAVWTIGGGGIRDSADLVHTASERHPWAACTIAWHAGQYETAGDAVRALLALMGRAS